MALLIKYTAKCNFFQPILPYGTTTLTPELMVEEFNYGRQPQQAR